MTPGQKIVIVGILVIVLYYYMQPTALMASDEGTAGGIDLSSAAGQSGATGYYGNGTGSNYDLTGYTRPNYGNPNYYQPQGGGDGVSIVASDNDADVLARTIYGEARGQSNDFMVAVANVVMNRFNAGSYAATIAGVCQAPEQFSCWNSDDPNLKIIESVSASNSNFQQCVQIANQAIAGQLADITGGATNYYTTPINRVPSWAGTMTPTIQIKTVAGEGYFFRSGGLFS